MECSPGTIVFHDQGYATRFPDLPFTPTALLLTRVVSRPRPGRICLDLGHKAVAADPAGPRVHRIDVPEATIVGHSEEHLVVDTPAADRYPVGTCVLAIPTHICPTSALHRCTYVIVMADRQANRSILASTAPSTSEGTIDGQRRTMVGGVPVLRNGVIFSSKSPSR